VTTTESVAEPSVQGSLYHPQDDNPRDIADHEAMVPTRGKKLCDEHFSDVNAAGFHIQSNDGNDDHGDTSSGKLRPTRCGGRYMVGSRLPYDGV
jgi:hypothetical protein